MLLAKNYISASSNWPLLNHNSSPSNFTQNSRDFNEDQNNLLNKKLISKKQRPFSTKTLKKKKQLTRNRSLISLSGTKISIADTLVNNWIPDSQRMPHSAKLSNNNIIVAWISLLQDGSDYGVYGKI